MALLVTACGTSDRASEIDHVAVATVAALQAQPAERGAPPEVRAASKDWPLANHDYRGTRATFDSRLSTANVSQLAEAWSFALPVGAGVGSATASALVLGDTVYYIDETSDVFALDAATGAVRWQSLRNVPSNGPNGLAVGWGKVFTTASDFSFVALDADTGEQVWSADIPVSTNAGISIAPIPYDGLVYLSTEPVNANVIYGGGVNGTLYALEQATGTVVWSFQTVEDSGLWGHPDINSGGGAWYPPTIDVTRGTMYWGIGNPAPFPGTEAFPSGTSRPGANLYTNSVVALGLLDGKLHWYHQEAPHDLFDLDFQNPPIVVTVEIDHCDRHLVIGSGKTGTVVALDADQRGKLLWRTAVGLRENDHISEIPDSGIEVFPGPLGGIDTPTAYADGTVYVPIVNWGTKYSPTAAGDLDATGTGELVALDVSDGSLRWQVELPSQVFGSVTVVNDLVITATFDGTVLAYDRDTGAEVWRYSTAPTALNAPLTVAGDMLIIPAGASETPALIALKLP